MYSLYYLSLKSITTFKGICFSDSKLIPNIILRDIVNHFVAMCEDGNQDYCYLVKLFENFDIFNRILSTHCLYKEKIDRYNFIWECFENLRYFIHVKIDKKNCKKISKSFVYEGNLEFGEILGNFLNRTGFYEEAELVLTSCLEKCNETQILNILKELLHSQYMNNKIEKANHTLQKIFKLNTKLDLVYSSIAKFYFLQQNYKQANDSSEKALKQLSKDISEYERINIYLTCIKIFVKEGKFRQVMVLFQKVNSDFSNVVKFKGYYTDILFADILKEYIDCLLHVKLMKKYYFKSIALSLKKHLTVSFESLTQFNQFYSCLYRRLNHGLDIFKIFRFPMFMLIIVVDIYENIFDLRNFQVERLKKELCIKKYKNLRIYEEMLGENCCWYSRLLNVYFWSL